MRCTVCMYFSLPPLSHEIWPCPTNTATPLIHPNFLDQLVTILTGSTVLMCHHYERGQYPSFCSKINTLVVWFFVCYYQWYLSSKFWPLFLWHLGIIKLTFKVKWKWVLEFALKINFWVAYILVYRYKLVVHIKL